jgi:hypothetical protein
MPKGSGSWKRVEIIKEAIQGRRYKVRAPLLATLYFVHIYSHFYI